MSDRTWPADAELPPLFRPEIYVGAASPLWGYFTGAALAGMAWWWMSRMTQLATWRAYTESWVEPMTEALAEAAGGPLAEALINEDEPAFPVGGEAAPFGAAVLEAELISEPALRDELTQPAEPPAPVRIPRPRRKSSDGEAKPH